MISHLYPESYTPFSSPHFSRSNATRISTLSTNSVTKKIILVRTVYFYNSGSIFATKNFCDIVCTQSKKLYEDILASLDREKMWAGKWFITFWVEIKIHREISTYFRLKHHCEKKSDIFLYSVSK